MKIRFGPAVDSRRADAKELISYLETALRFSNEAVELSLTKTSKVVYDVNVSGLLNKFKYRSIHLPVLKKEDELISYPDGSIEGEMKIIDQYIADISPNTVLVHPDQVSDFEWATKNTARYWLSKI